MYSESWVSDMVGQSGFPAVSGLPSPIPRPAGLRRFVATQPSSDFPDTYMVVVRVCPCTTRPARLSPADTSGISRFPRVKLLGMLRVSDTASASDDLR